MDYSFFGITTNFGLSMSQAKTITLTKPDVEIVWKLDVYYYKTVCEIVC